jgi:signal recognition particle GTPase
VDKDQSDNPQFQPHATLQHIHVIVSIVDSDVRGEDAIALTKAFRDPTTAAAEAERMNKLENGRSYFVSVARLDD